MGARGGTRGRLDRAPPGPPRLSSPEEGRRVGPRAGGRCSTSGARTTTSRGAVPSRAWACCACPHDCYSIVRDRIVRDSIHAGPLREHRARLPGVRGLLQGQPRRARGPGHRALRGGRARRARARALCEARRRQDRARPAAGQALQAPGGRQPLRHLSDPARRLQHVPGRKRVLPLVARGRAGASSTAQARSRPGALREGHDEPLDRAQGARGPHRLEAHRPARQAGRSREAHRRPRRARAGGPRAPRLAGARQARQDAAAGGPRRLLRSRRAPPARGPRRSSCASASSCAARSRRS